MANSDSVRAYMAISAINLFPSLVKTELLSDSKMLEELAITTDATVHFGNRELAFSRSSLFDAIRSAFENTGKDFFLDDVKGNSWSLRYHQDERPAFSLTLGDLQIFSDSFWPLCADVDRRLSLFETEAKGRSLSKDERLRWRTVLSTQTISDDDVSEYLKRVVSQI